MKKSGNRGYCIDVHDIQEKVSKLLSLFFLFVLRYDTPG